jgi:hypothetical protein
VRVARVQDPTDVRVRTFLDHLPDQPYAEPLAAVLRQDVHVGEVDERDAVGERPREPDLPAVVVDADDALRFADEPLDHRERPSLGPIRVVREVVVDSGDVDALGIVVELDRHHALRSVRSRKLPKYS